MTALSLCLSYFPYATVLPPDDSSCKYRSIHVPAMLEMQRKSANEQKEDRRALLYTVYVKPLQC